MKKALCAVLLAGILPFPAFASTLTQGQVDALIQVLQAFGVDQATVTNVEHILAPSAPETTLNLYNNAPTYTVVPQYISMTQTTPQYGNVGTTSTTQTQQTQPTQQPSAPYVYIDPLLPQWKQKLSDDLESLDPKTCASQNIETCQFTATDAVTESKYAINAGLTVGDAATYASTTSSLIDSWNTWKEGVLTSGGPSGPLQGTAAEADPVIGNLQQVVSILTTRVWP